MATNVQIAHWISLGELLLDKVQRISGRSVSRPNYTAQVGIPVKVLAKSLGLAPRTIRRLVAIEVLCHQGVGHLYDDGRDGVCFRDHIKS